MAGNVEDRDTSLIRPSASEINLYQSQVEDMLAGARADNNSAEKILLRDLLDISPTLNEAASAIIDDSFTRCFKSNAPEPWNWNLYLFPLWIAGVIVRYGILFPIRLMLLIVGWTVFLGLFLPVHVCMKKHDELRQKMERGLVEFICSAFVASWTGVVRYHGPKPSRRPKQVFVANHTSMIDFIVLEQMTAFAVIMQKHPGWVGLLQSTVLESLGCIWFNRTESKDRLIVAKKLKQHVESPSSNPLLVFPEGTCVNNEYTVMFKKGAFELDCTVCPIAIKYNKIFVDAFWNSKKYAHSHFGCFVAEFGLLFPRVPCVVYDHLQSCLAICHVPNYEALMKYMKYTLCQITKHFSIIHHAKIQTSLYSNLGKYHTSNLWAQIIVTLIFI